MSNDDDPTIISKEGFLQVKLHNQPRWHRRYCMIDWDKATLFVASKWDRQYGDWIKLLPKIVILDSELPSDSTIEIRSDNEIHFLQPDSKKEYHCWLIALKRTAYSRFGGGIFGQSLDDTYKYSLDKTFLVPVLVRQCCEFLLEHGTTFAGLFRIPGRQSSTRELRDRYDRGEQIELDASHSPATIASLLKMYLQCLPEPIIPTKNFDEFLEIGSRLKSNSKTELDNLKQLIESKLSNINYAVLAYLCLFLKKLTEYAPETKMDAENLTITFGSNLIRTSEEFDINMIRGHNCHLFPLIKALIDYSEYLFAGQLNETYELNNGSITKSSGFSSFSSLLSSNEHQTTLNIRSSSLPSLLHPTSPSIDSAKFSYIEQSDEDAVQYRSKSITEKPIRHISFPCHNHPASKHSVRKEYPINEEKDENPINDLQKKFPSNDKLINTPATRKEHKRRSGILWPSFTRNNACPSTPASSRQSLTAKMGKQFSAITSTMSKAFYTRASSTENLDHADTTEVSFRTPLYREEDRRSLDSNLTADTLKALQNEICVLKGIIDKKEITLQELTKTTEDERHKYEKENLGLKRQIVQLQLENRQLKIHHSSDN